MYDRHGSTTAARGDPGLSVGCRPPTWLPSTASGHLATDAGCRDLTAGCRATIVEKLRVLRFVREPVRAKVLLIETHAVD